MRSLKANRATYRLVLPRTIILMGHCLLVHSSFTVNDSSRANPCKLAFNGIRRNDPASSRCLSSCSFLSPHLSLRVTTGAKHCAIDRIFSFPSWARIVARCEFVTLARGSIDLGAEKHAAWTEEKNRSEDCDQRNERMKRARRSNNRTGMYINILPWERR